MEIRITPYRSKNKGEHTMKKCLFMLIVLSGLLAITGPAMAWSPGGNVDTFLTSAYLADSGDQTELDWVNGYLKTSYTIADLVTYPAPMIWEWTGGLGIWAIEFGFETEKPGYFFIQTWSVPGITTPNHFLYQNIDNLDWGVVSLGALGGFVQVWKINQIGEIGGGTQVPEPSLLLLLGAGLVGIGAATWRKIK
jgi:hypothetical protein